MDWLSSKRRSELMGQCEEAEAGWVKRASEAGGKYSLEIWVTGLGGVIGLGSDDMNLSGLLFVGTDSREVSLLATRMTNHHLDFVAGVQARAGAGT